MDRRAALALGVRAEALVAARLVAAGATVLARNWSGGGGELDLVVIRDGRLRFVEVKARTDDTFDPLEAVGPGKRRRLLGAAEAWLAAHPVDSVEACFLVAVVDPRTEPWAVAWYDDAF